MKFNFKKRTFFDATESATLSDLGFLLIIYFIVIAGFNINLGFLMNLPQKNSTKIVNVEELMKLNLGANGEILLNGNTLTKDDLKLKIKEKITLKPNMTLLLKINSETAFQNVVDIINIAKEMKVDNFSFTMIKE